MSYPQGLKVHIFDGKNLQGVSGNPVIVEPDGVIVQPVSIVAEGGTTLNTSQVAVGSSATLLAAANGNRKAICITNGGTVDVFIGGSSVTTSTGHLLVGVKGASIVLEVTAAIYGIIASGSEPVTVLEIT